MSTQEYPPEEPDKLYNPASEEELTLVSLMMINLQHLQEAHYPELKHVPPAELTGSWGVKLVRDLPRSKPEDFEIGGFDISGQLLLLVPEGRIHRLSIVISRSPLL